MRSLLLLAPLAASLACTPEAPRAVRGADDTPPLPAGDDVDATGDDDDDDPPDDACPEGVVCVAALPFAAHGTTVGGTSRFHAYACGTQDESGPERVYRVTLPGPGTFAVALDDALEDADSDEGGVDVDVHILTSLDESTCVARGDRRAFVSFEGDGATGARAVFVALDSFVRADGTVGAGAFSATFTFVPAGDEADLEGAGVATLVAAGVDDEVATLAMRAYANALAQDLTDSTTYSVIDFSLPSTQQRLWIVDLASGELLVRDRVTHGIGSNSADDPTMADAFSNTPGSSQSSLGLSRTAETYEGSNGYSLRLDGLEASNSNMRDRAIVMHGAEYAEDGFVDENGFLGRSNGCPAVAMSRSAGIIDIVKEGTLIFSYYPDAAWLASSEMLD